MDIRVIRSTGDEFQVTVGCQEGTISNEERLTLIKKLSNPENERPFCFYVFDGATWYGPFDTVTSRIGLSGRREIKATSKDRPNAFGRDCIVLDWAGVNAGQITYEPLGSHPEN